MITIALDEQGDFENIKNELDTAPVFIGGIIYDDMGNENDYKNEKKRLKEYLKKICESVNVKYPIDLHYHSKNGVNNGSKVRRVKERFDHTIADYLEKGTYEGDNLIDGSRIGTYRLFVNLRGAKGKTELLYDDISEAVRENYASNLYLHMAEGVVERLLFHNPVLEEINHVKLQLAARMAVFKTTDLSVGSINERKKEYEKLGYRNESSSMNDDSIRAAYKLTNPYNYRTAIGREMLRGRKKSIMIDRISVKSIYYDRDTNNMDFLYLADLICSHLSYNKSGNTPDEWIKSFSGLANDINSNSENMIWGYDEADVYFENAWIAMEEGDYFRALSYAFNGTVCESSMREYYSQKWYPLIEKAIIKSVNTVDLSIAIRKFKAALMNNNINQQELVYIFKVLEKAGDKVYFSNSKEESTLYDLYDAGVSAFTHIGDLKNAKRCYDKTLQYAEYVATEVYLRTRNRMVVFLGDMLEFDKALKIADENVDYHEHLLEMKKKMFNNAEFVSLNYAIALSQRAQIYAFMEDDRAEDDFVKALEIMDKETPDRLITESYLMHYYISKQKKERYENLAKEYFGGKEELIDQFNYIAREGAKKRARFSLKYAIYVYIKALYVFYIQDVQRSSKLRKKLKDIDKALGKANKNAVRQINGHPWEIIYKYLSMIMFECGEIDAVEIYKVRIMAYVDGTDGIIKDIAIESLKACEAVEKKREDCLVSKYTYMYT